MTVKRARNCHRLVRAVSLLALGYAFGRAHQYTVDTAKFADYGAALKTSADALTAALRHRSERHDRP